MPVTTELVPVTLAVVDALLVGDAEFSARYGMAIAPGYLDFPGALSITRDALLAGTPPQWSSHLFVHRETLTVVGFGGDKGPPVSGEVEIGYSVAPDHQRRGHATSAVAQLVAAANARGVAVVSAMTLPEESPSTRILRRAGFAMTATTLDPELGEVWQWELPLRARP